MAMQAENMDYGKLKELVDSLSCRSISPLVLPEVPLGSFTLMTFPMTQVEGTENPGVHYFDLIVDHADDIDFFGLSSSYKLACEKKDIALLPAPFGLKAACPKETTIQIAILKQPDGKKAILKHVSFPDKVKVSFVQQICFGSPYRPLFMKSNPKVGRKILQYCFENLGGHAFRCFDLSSQATRRGQSKTSMPFEDKEDAEIDEGFNYILRTAPRSSCEMAQLRWQTKELRNKPSPIFGWPGALISQALKTFKPIRHYVVDEFHRVNHKCSKKKLTRNEKKRLAKVRTNMSEVFNAWIRKKKIALNAMNPYSHRFWVQESIRFWNQNLETMPKYITRRSTATTRKRKAMKWATVVPWQCKGS